MKKGISLVVLIITIIVLIILAGVAIFNSSNMMGSVEKSKLQVDIVQLEALMNTYKIRKNGNINFEVTQFSTSTLNMTELKQFEGEDIVNNTISLYVIDLIEIDADAVNYGNQGQGASDRYLYSINTGKVYYEQGLKIDDDMYYYVEDGE